MAKLTLPAPQSRAHYYLGTATDVEKNFIGMINLCIVRVAIIS